MLQLKTKRGCRLILLLVTLACSGLCSAASQWGYGTIDSAGGRSSSLKVDSEGNAHVAYITGDGQNTLKYGFWDRNLKRWSIMVVDKEASFCSLALDSKQRPHISYADFGSSKEGRLRYAYWNGASWAKNTIMLADGVSFYTSIGLDRNDRPYISYSDYLAPDSEFVLHLRVAHWNDQYWEVRTADDQDGSGKFNSLAVDEAGTPQIAYANVKDPNQSLRYARWTGSGWRPEILDPSCYVWSVAVALDKQGIPHISYMDHGNKLLKYATMEGNKWRIETITAVHGVAYPDRNGVAIDSQGKLYMTYYDAGSGSLILVYRNLANWTLETVDSGRVGFTSSIAVDRDSILITYTDEATRTLKFARRPLPENASEAK